MFMMSRMKFKTTLSSSWYETIGVLGLTHMVCGVTLMVNVAEYIAAAEKCSVKAVDFFRNWAVCGLQNQKCNLHSPLDIDIKKT